VAFDVVFLNGDDLTTCPYGARRQALEALALDSHNHKTLPLWPGTDADRSSPHAKPKVSKGCFL
jgi:ATP-dependent DNA ligase